VLTCLLNWKNVFMILVLLLTAMILRHLCVSTIARLKQLESIARSPLFNHLSTTLCGLATIRAHRIERDFEHRFVNIQNEHTAAYFNMIMCYRWVGIVMYWVCACFVAVVTVLAVLLVGESSTSAGILGLLISQAIMLPGPYQQITKQLIQTEGEMTAVERIRQLSEDLELEEEFVEEVVEEKSAGSGSGAPNGAQIGIQTGAQSGQRSHEHMLANFRGGLRFREVSLHYDATHKPVLDQVSLSINPGEKVGVVGRTGAGKSSLIAVLFRLYNFRGHIELDGVDSKRVGLRELRKSMSIIPQDPVLFGGSLRKNLDPFGEHSDQELWAALEAVQLKQLFNTGPHSSTNSNGLQFQIQEGGSNFSLGQRQLVCLARAIVRRNKLLVLDEATANVDPETDNFIQRTIANQFAHCTVLTIAHRLITIVDSDRVLVLDKGQVAEFGPPHELLQKPDGLFARMVDSSAQQAPRIRKLILEAHQRRQEKTQEAVQCQNNEYM